MIVANPQLAALARECEQLGLSLGTDFYVAGLPIPGLPSSEHIGIAFDDAGEGSYQVWYKDMGDSRDLLVTPSFDDAAARLVEEAVQLAGPRGRGPQARTDVRPEMPINEILGRIWRETHGDDEPPGSVPTA